MRDHVAENLQTAAEIDWLRQRYKLLRRILPIAFPSKRGLHEIAIHVRAGHGSRSLSDGWFVPAVAAVRRALEDHGLAVRIHVFHEAAKSSLCCAGFEEMARALANGNHTTSLKTHMDHNRISMFAALVEADVLMCTDSTFCHVAGFVNEKALAIIDATQTRSAHMDLDGPRRIRWRPCSGSVHRTPWTEARCSAARPTVGFSEHQLRRLLSQAIGNP